MAKKIKNKSNGIPRSDIPYKDRLMVNQFANIAQHRDHSALVANKVGMVALNDTEGLGYLRLSRFAKRYHFLNEEYYKDPEYQEQKHRYVEANLQAIPHQARQQGKRSGPNVCGRILCGR